MDTQRCKHFRIEHRYNLQLKDQQWYNKPYAQATIITCWRYRERMEISPAMDCKLVEPSDTKLSHMHSANSNSRSSMLGGDIELHRNEISLDTLSKIWKILVIAASYSGPEASRGLLLQHQYQRKKSEQKTLPTNLKSSVVILTGIPHLLSLFPSKGCTNYMT